MIPAISKLATCALLTLILAGCGGASAVPTAAGPGNPTAAGQPAGAIDSCSILSDEEIAMATGQDVSERSPSTLTQVFPSVCDIELDGGGTLVVSVLHTGGRSMYETSFEPFIGEGDTPPLDAAVEGLGDKAAISGDDNLMVLKDDVLFDVFYIEFGRSGKAAVVRYLAERILARLPCIATGCPDLPVPPAPTAGPADPSPTLPAIDPGSLPATGAQARVVNLYSENGQPVTVDVYVYAWSEAEMREVAALVATVPYGTASAWFNPGLVESPFGADPYTKVDIFRQGDQSDLLVGTSEFLGAGTVTTLEIWQDEIYEGQPSAWLQTIYAQHPEYEIPQAPPGGALLLSKNGGLAAEKDEPFLYASVGDGCLESPIPRSIPDIPNVQPVGNDLALPLGQHTLTVHGAPPLGELPTCEAEPLGPGTPISVAAGDRLLAFPYRLTGATDVSLLVMPFDTP